MKRPSTTIPTDARCIQINSPSPILTAPLKRVQDDRETGSASKNGDDLREPFDDEHDRQNYQEPAKHEQGTQEQQQPGKDQQSAAGIDRPPAPRAGEQDRLRDFDPARNQKRQPEERERPLPHYKRGQNSDEAERDRDEGQNRTRPG